jgi:hypothetical protein
MFCEVFWLRKIRLFAETLLENEHVLGGVWCFMRKRLGRLVATESRILFLGQRGVWGSVVESFNYSRLNSVEMTKGFFFGEMTITSGMASQQVEMVPKFQLTPFMKLVQAKLTGLSTEGGDKSMGQIPEDSSDVEMMPGVVTLIERLATLRSKGILSDDEFEQNRSRLLELSSARSPIP